LVWNDYNNNGVVDASEPGISGVTVKLYSSNGSTPLATTTTDANGKYLFADLSEGTYIVEVNIPTYISKGVTRYYVSSDDTTRLSAYTPDSRDNDDNGLYDATKPAIVRSAVVTLSAGDEPSNEFDQNQPINGVVDSTAPANSNFHVDFGFYQPGVIRTAFWIDLNGDGIRQNNETSLAKVVVAIFRFYRPGMSRQAMDLVPATDIHGQAVPTQTVGTDGFAFFPDLPPGEYVFQVTPPEGYALTQGGTDPDDDNPHDSNGVLVDGMIQSLPMTLLPGTEPTDDGDGAEGNQTIGFGFNALTGIGDRVWMDKNGNGLQDNDEEGIAGVIINLYNAQGALLGTVVTDAAGHYHFLNLTPGQYYLTFVLPPGYLFTSDNLGGDRNVDSDADPSTGSTPLLQVSSGQYNITLDVGIVKQPTALNNTDEPSTKQQIYLPLITTH